MNYINVGITQKMNFVAGSISSSDIITMMQIDCTVIDTKLLHVRQKDIPAHFKTLPVKNLQKSNTSYLKEGISPIYY